MLQRIFKRQDTCAGLMFLGIGIAALWIGREYPAGTATAMGPGFFPNLLSILLCGLGALITLRGFLRDGEQVSRIDLRPFLVIVAVALFALLVEGGGLVLAIVALVTVGAAAGREFRLREVLAITAGLVVLSLVVFEWGLGLNMSLWPGG